jgi:hypothetical protein
MEDVPVDGLVFSVGADSSLVIIVGAHQVVEIVDRAGIIDQASSGHESGL